MANKAHRTREQCKVLKKSPFFLHLFYIFLLKSVPSVRIHLSSLQLLFTHLIRMIKNLKKNEAHLSVSSLLYCVMLFESPEREKKWGLTCSWPNVFPLHHLISKHFTSTCETRLYYKMMVIIRGCSVHVVALGCALVGQTWLRSDLRGCLKWKSLNWRLICWSLHPLEARNCWVSCQMKGWRQPL